MKKQIRLLIEGLFDDIYDLNNGINDVIELGNEIYNFNIGDIFYLDKKQYAICLSLDSCDEFENRFILLQNGYDKLTWTTDKDLKNKIKESQFHNFDIMVDELEYKIDEEEINKANYDEYDPDQALYFGFNLFGISGVHEIDENGYENTQIIKNNYDINKFPAFNYCCSLGDNVYLPAIDELQYLFCNLKTLQKKYFENTNEKSSILPYGSIWSSSVLILGWPFYLYHAEYAKNQVKIDTELDYKANNIVLPFVKI